MRNAFLFFCHAKLIIKKRIPLSSVAFYNTKEHLKRNTPIKNNYCLPLTSSRCNAAPAYLAANSSDSSLKKSTCNTFDIRVSMAVSMLLRSRRRYTVERLQPISLASHPAERFCRFSSSCISCPIFTISHWNRTFWNLRQKLTPTPIDNLWLPMKSFRWESIAKRY